MSRSQTAVSCMIEVDFPELEGGENRKKAAVIPEDSAERMAVKTKPAFRGFRQGASANLAMMGLLIGTDQLTPTARLLIQYLLQRVGSKNYVGGTYREMAAALKVNTSSITRACRLLMGDGLNFMVPAKGKKKQSLWMINPEYFWKAHFANYHRGVWIYQGHQKRRAEKKEQQLMKDNREQTVDFNVD